MCRIFFHDTYSFRAFGERTHFRGSHDYYRVMRRMPLRGLPDHRFNSASDNNDAPLPVRVKNMIPVHEGFTVGFLCPEGRDPIQGSGYHIHFCTREKQTAGGGKGEGEDRRGPRRPSMDSETNGPI